ncbi:MAG: FAD-binding protein [Acidimicrobiales bacterium]
MPQRSTDLESRSIEGTVVPSRPLRVAVLVKQVPATDSLALGADGRLHRQSGHVEMNPFCRRAVSMGVELARVSGGECIVFTLGPPSADDVLREAVAWGADRGVHLCDPAFAGSDTLATARALVAELRRHAPFDLVVAGRNSVDGDTGQVGPEVAELIGVPFAAGVRRLGVADDVLRLGLEHDDGFDEVEMSLPAVISVAERLCDPCKVTSVKRAAVQAVKIRRVTAGDLGEGPWGEAGSATRVGVVRQVAPDRDGMVLRGDPVAQVEEAVRILDVRRALGGQPARLRGGPTRAADTGHRSHDPRPADRSESPPIGVVLEPHRPQVDAELLGMASHLAADVGGEVVALSVQYGSDSPTAGQERDTPRSGVEPRARDGHPTPAPASLDALEELGALGADEVLALCGEWIADDVAAAVGDWVAERRPWLVIAPGTAFGREVAGRVAAATGSGLIGDAIAADLADGHLVATKPAFAGAQVADVTCTSPVEMVTFRPGMLAIPPRRLTSARVTRRSLATRGRVRVLSRHRDDDVEVLTRATAVIGVGMGVRPDEYSRLGTLAALLGAELAATRKVTDRGWAPRSRQVGITGRSIAPDLYVGIGLSGKLNHMVGTRSAGTVLVINSDPDAPAFTYADIGIVGDWHDVVPLLEDALRSRSASSRRPDTRRPTVAPPA